MPLAFVQMLRMLPPAPMRSQGCSPAGLGGLVMVGPVVGPVVGPIGSVGPVDPHWLYLLGAVGLAVHLGRDGGRAWQNA